MTREVGYSWRFVLPVLIGPVLNPINTTMIAVALVPVSTDLEVPAATVVWLVAGLYLASAIAQPTMGKLADTLGPKRVYLAGLAIVVVAGVLPSLAQGFGWVVAARVLIGIGTSAAYPSAMTIIRDQSGRLGRETPPVLLSGLSIASQATAAIGPVLGGLLIAAFGWRSIFLVNLPLALLALVTAWIWLPSDRGRPGAAGPGRTDGTADAGASRRDRTRHLLGSLDLGGIALFAITLSALLVLLLDLAAGLWWLLAVAVAAGAGLVVLELRHPTPFIDLRMLARNGALTRTYLRLFLLFLSAYSMVYGFSQWLQSVAGYSSETAGLLQTPMAVLSVAAALTVARTRRLRLPLVLAGLLPFVGGLILLFLHAASPAWVLLVIAGLFGLAQGLASVTNQAALYRQAPGAQIGTASGLSRTSIYLGAIVSSAVIGLAFGEHPSDAGLHGLAWLIVVATALAALIALLDPALRGRGDAERRDPPSVPGDVT